jgi:ribonuclease P protein component
MFCLRRDDAAVQGVRVGFTTPRALGKATVRNRVRRRLREAVRLRLGEVTAAVDLVFQPRRNVLTADWQTLQREVERVLGKCGI